MVLEGWRCWTPCSNGYLFRNVTNAVSQSYLMKSSQVAGDLELRFVPCIAFSNPKSLFSTCYSSLWKPFRSACKTTSPYLSTWEPISSIVALSLCNCNAVFYHH